MRRRPFDLQAALPAAWNLLWAARVARQGKDAFRESQSHYVTATDLENQVRRFADEEANGEPWGTRGEAWGRDYSLLRISTGSRRDLLGVCRDWLMSEVSRGRLEAHNFGRGHISGMRFRPRDHGLTEAEEATLATKARRRETPRPVHFSRGHRPACLKASKRQGFGYRPSKAHLCGVWERVTCLRCLKLQATFQVEAVS